MVRNHCWSFLIAILLFFASVAHAESVGRVIFAVGDVQLQRNGELQSVEQGMSVLVGDRLETGSAGHVHLLMSDEGFFSLRPQSRMTLEAYNYDADDLSANRVKVNLETGVLRTSTGKAGQANKQQYRVNTPVAAIGVRGTDYTVQATDTLSRIGVRAGGVVMSPFGAGCTPAAGGPCEGDAAGELFAANVGAVLEARLGEKQAVVTYDAPTPDDVNPPLPEEERALNNLRVGLASGKAHWVLNEDDLAAYEERLKEVEDYIAGQPLVQLAESLGKQEGEQVLPENRGLVEEPAVVWGRFSQARDFIGSAASAQAATERKSQATISQLLDENWKYAGIQEVFALLENENVDRAVPSDGQAAFKLNSYEAYVKRGSYLEEAGISGASLIVDFDESRFATHLNVHAATIQDPITVVGSGDLKPSGYFTSDSDSPTDIVGIVTGGGSEAGMLFEHEIIKGSDIWAVGATNWVNSTLVESKD